MLFRKQIKFNSNIKYERVWRNVLWNLHYQMLYCIKAQDRKTTDIAVLRYGVMLSSSLHLFRFFILVFHLKQKHEEGERLLHYLQQANLV